MATGYTFGHDVNFDTPHYLYATTYDEPGYTITIIRYDIINFESLVIDGEQCND